MRNRLTIYSAKNESAVYPHSQILICRWFPERIFCRRERLRRDSSNLRPAFSPIIPVDLAYDEGVEHDDGDVGDEFDEDELGPEDVVGFVGVAGSERRHDDVTLLAVVVKLEEARHVVSHWSKDSIEKSLIMARKIVCSRKGAT